MSKKFYTLNIPVKAYLKKYLQSLYGLNDTSDSPIIFTTENYFGTSLLGYLSTRIYLQSSALTYKSFDRFDSEITVMLPKHWLTDYHYKTLLHKCNIIYLNKHFEERFEEDMVRYCFYFRLSGVEVKKSLEDFCRIHGIEIDGDITYEALVKKEYRSRKFFEKNMGKSDIQKNVSIQTMFF